MAVLFVAAAAMSVPAFAGQTQAERGKIAGEAGGPGISHEWQMRVAMETGNLPAGDARQVKSESGAKTVVPTVEAGGSFYRIGVDTP